MKKIMIVDDEEDSRQFLAKIAKRQGFEAVSCGDGVTAVEMFKKEKPEIVFLDVFIPLLKGEEVFEEIRKIDPGVKVYFISGSVAVIDRLVAKNMPAAGYILKPLFLENIVKILNEIK